MTENKKKEKPKYYGFELGEDLFKEIQEKVKEKTWVAGSFDGEAIAGAGVQGGGTLLNYQDFTDIMLQQGDTVAIEYEFQHDTTAEEFVEQLDTILESIESLKRARVLISSDEEEAHAEMIESTRQAVYDMNMSFEGWAKRKTIGYRAKAWLKGKFRRKKKDLPLIWNWGKNLHDKDRPFGRAYVGYADGTSEVIDTTVAQKSGVLSAEAAIIEKEIERRRLEREAHESFKAWCESIMRSLYIIEKQTDVLRDIEEQIGLIEPPKELREFMSQIKLMLAKAKERVGTC